MFVIPATSHINSEESLRTTLPKAWINKSRCQDLVHALLNYHYKYDDERGRPGKLPYHDWSSNGCDAAEIMARTWQEKGETQSAIESRALEERFHRLRRENNLNKGDPYRVKPALRKNR